MMFHLLKYLLFFCGDAKLCQISHLLKLASAVQIKRDRSPDQVFHWNLDIEGPLIVNDLCTIFRLHKISKDPVQIVDRCPQICFLKICCAEHFHKLRTVCKWLQLLLQTF